MGHDRVCYAQHEMTVCCCYHAVLADWQVPLETIGNVFFRNAREMGVLRHGTTSLGWFREFDSRCFRSRMVGHVKEPQN